MKKILLILAAMLVLVGCARDDGSMGDTSVVTGTVADGAIISSGVDVSSDDTSETETDPGYGTVGPLKGAPLEEKDGVFIITEEKYIYGVDEIYKAPDSYEGERVEFEGVYISEMINGNMYYRVYRTLERGCTDEHGHDHGHTHEEQIVGFIITHEGNNKPTDNSFVHVSGIVEAIEVDGELVPVINADVLEVCEPGILIYRQ